MQRALNHAVPASGLEWTEMRWDTVDITATWSQDESHRNIHGWVLGDWPVFSLRFEGSAWEDDERSLSRRVVFFSGPMTTVRVVEGGSTPQAKIEIPNPDALVKDVQGLVARLQAVKLKDAPWDHKLLPRPDRHFTPQN